MKFTHSWLKDYLETTATLDQIVDGLVGVGLEVEQVENKSKMLSPFKVAYVVEAVKHPNADKLRLCKVETDTGTIQVVCGAPNARSGMKAIIALPGAIIPFSRETLEAGMIRGSESQGMMCSERELLISQEHDGIIEVASEWPVGTLAATALGLDDPMIYVKVTANRPDALGVYGIARDLAAKGLGTLKPLQAKPVAGTFESPIRVSLDFNGDNTPCPLFVGRYIRNVRNGMSPDWLQRRLKAIGLRPISTLVDITNYITFAYGRPLHVFDAAKVNGNIRARMANDGESLVALDGKRYTLNSSMTVIADDRGAEGIAGIMGGEASGCSESTTDVFLEAAYFDPVRTAATGRKLGIVSDARYRFERGVDPIFTPVGAEIASRMILDLCGGSASHLVVAGEVPHNNRTYTLRPTRVKALAGVEIPPTEQKRILQALGFSVNETGQGFVCAVPTWRPDVHGEADLVEDVIRIFGVDNIPAASMDRPHPVAKPVLNILQRRMLASRRTLSARGFNEAVTWSFLSEENARLFGGGQAELKLANPISTELSDMRPSLLPNLVAAVARNVKRGFADVAISEIGHAYAGDRPTDETLRAAGVRRGFAVSRSWLGGARPVDTFDAKADVLAVLEATGIPLNSLQVVAGGPSWYHPGRSGTIQMGPQNRLAWFGELHPRVLAALDVKGPLAAFEAVLNAIPAPKAKSATRAALAASDLLCITRDFAFVVGDAVEADKVVKAAKAADKILVTDVTVFDVFKLEGTKKSYAIEVTLQPRDRTFTDEDIDAVSQRIIAGVTKATGGVLRS